MAKDKHAKKKAREEKLKQRKAKVGTVVKPGSCFYDPNTGKIVSKNSFTNSLAVDLMNESDTTPIYQKNIDKLGEDWYEYTKPFHTGTKNERAHARLFENVFLGKQLLSVVSSEFVPVDKEQDLMYRVHLSIIKDDILAMEKVIIYFWNELTKGNYNLTFKNTLEFNQSKVADKFIKSFLTLVSYCDIGLFQKACRLSKVKLMDKSYQAENIKYYRYADHTEIHREQAKYLLEKKLREKAEREQAA